MTASATSSAGFGGFAIVLFLALSLPGLGEQLGTSDRIQNAVQWAYSEFGNLFASF
jgi:Na+/H+ antiporter NhaC